MANLDLVTCGVGTIFGTAFIFTLLLPISSKPMLSIMSKWYGSIVQVMLVGICIASLSNFVQGEQVVVVILDDSGSMNEKMRTNSGSTSRMGAARNSLIKVINSLPEDTKFGVRLLNGKNVDRKLIPLGLLNREDAVKTISRVSATGGTPLGQVMREGADELLQYRNLNKYGSFRLLIITDGEANDRDLVATYLPMILARGISIDVIGVGMKETHQLASQAHSYRSVNDAEGLEKAVSEILAEPLDNQDISQDFELLAQIPDEFASQAIESLTSPDNSPLTAGSEDSNIERIYNPESNANGTGDTVLGFACCGFIPCMMTLLVIAIIFRVIKKQNRR